MLIPNWLTQGQKCYEKNYWQKTKEKSEKFEISKFA
jgi:hypothetical protein